MADIDDLELARSEMDAGVPPPSRPSWLPVIGVVAVAVAAAAAWYFWPREATTADGTVRTETEQVVVPPASSSGVAEPGENIDLPPLDAMDGLVRELVARLSSHPRTAAWLTSDHLIRDFAAIVVNIAHGDTPAPHLKHVRPDGAFEVREDGMRIQIHPRSYQRYDSYAAAVSGLDARGTARLYATVKPRIEEAYQELGAPDGTFDRTLEKAIVRLLQTPIVEGDVPLRATSVAYTFADPALESLSPAQKQFLRMGPANMRVIKEKLREIAGYLGFQLAG